MVLRITLSRETRVSDKSPVMFVLANVYRPPGHHTDFIKEFADFLSELVLAADKVLIVGNFKGVVDWFFLGLIVFMGCSLACVSCLFFFKTHYFSHNLPLFHTSLSLL